jgi:cysteine synthase A
VSIAHPDHPVNVARRKAEREGHGSVFADQFENLANLRAHLATGEEIWRQTAGRVGCFVCGAGTGGTIAGVSAALKARNPSVKVLLVDPPGSSLYNSVARGVAYAPAEAEGRRLRHPDDTVVEGVGLNRLTANFGAARVDGALKCNDREAVEMAAYLVR